MFRTEVGETVGGVSMAQRDALYVSTTEKTFSNEETLPNLPIPPLENTIEKYLISVKALVSDEEYKETEELAMRFLNGQGKTLHNALMKRATHHRNWLEKWWEDLAYLQQRTALLPMCSMAGFCSMEHLWPPTPGSQIEHAALYLHYQLGFWKLLRKEMLRPHYSHDVPWSMFQFRRFFSTVRLPGESIDRIECHFHTESEDPSSPTHVIILHQGHIFTFDAVDEYGEILTPPEIELQMRRITEWCEENGPGSGVGALTVDDRSVWAKNYDRLLKINPENAMHMETINTSLVVLSLDDAEPTNNTEIVGQTLGGDCTNRWADKSCIDVIYSNGTFGMISDHTPFDGLVPVVVGHYSYSSINECGGVWKGIQVVNRDLLPPRHLEFHLDDQLKTAIEESKRNYKTRADDVDVFCGSFTHYGKSFLKPYNIHPEAYIQLALQYGYYMMHERPAPTYVTASTRQFYHGRTETMRACFEEVIDWVKSMVENPEPSSHKLKLFHIAAEKFKSLMKDCMQNHGCDRHLLGLYMISVEEQQPIPEIFMDPSWVKSGGSGNFVLSTSCCGYTLIGGCVMPMKENGYGTFYSIENKRMTFTISAFNRCPETNSSKFYEHIETALLHMEQLLLSSKL